MSTTDTNQAFGKGVWYHEKLDHGLYHSMENEKTHFEGTSKF
jgi:hypothetical protein